MIAAPTNTLIYKILGAAEWRDAVASGTYLGSADDARDGFIHFSAAGQVAGTAGKYFRGKTDLVLVEIDTARLGPALRWEASRGGALFPHLYGSLDASVAVRVLPMRLDAEGVPVVAVEIG